MRNRLGKSALCAIMSIVLVVGLMPLPAFAKGSALGLGQVKSLQADDAGLEIASIDQYAYFLDVDGGKKPLFEVWMSNGVMLAEDGYEVVLYGEAEDDGGYDYSSEVGFDKIEAGVRYSAKVTPLGEFRDVDPVYTSFEASGLPEELDFGDGYYILNTIVSADNPTALNVYSGVDSGIWGKLVCGRHYSATFFQDGTAQDEPGEGFYNVSCAAISPFSGVLNESAYVVDPSNPINMNEVDAELYCNAPASSGVPDVRVDHVVPDDWFTMSKGRHFDLAYLGEEGDVVDKAPTELGKHVARVCGKGLFTGSVDVEYEVVSDSDVSLLNLTSELTYSAGESFDVVFVCSNRNVWVPANLDSVGEDYDPEQGVDYMIMGYYYLDAGGEKHMVSSTADLPAGKCFAVVKGVGDSVTGATDVLFWVDDESGDDDDNDAGDDEGDGEGDDEEEATVQSISFEPANPYVIVAETNGYWSDEGEDEDEEAADRFYCYYLPEFQEGDELTVVDLDGNSVVYTYCYDDDAEEWVFSSDDAGSIVPSCGSDQRENHWVLGDSNKMTLHYGGCSCEVPVSVIKNPVASISFEPVEAYKLKEGIGARWDGDDLFYEPPAFAQGDKLTVFDVDGGETVYTFRFVEADDEDDEGDEDPEGRFISDAGTTLDAGQVSRRLDGDGCQWDVGEHQLTIGYSGRECTVPVELVANPVKSISYQPSKSYQLVEEVDGSWETWEDGDEEVLFFLYETPWIDLGDILTVAGDEGRETEYVCIDDENGGRVFRSATGETISAEYVSLRYADSQYEVNWKAGETHQVVVGYAGRTSTFPVEVVSNPVTSISFQPHELYRLIEELDGSWCEFDEDEEEEGEGDEATGRRFEYYTPSFQAGDELTVVGDSGTAIYTYQQRVVEEDEEGESWTRWLFVSEDDEEIAPSDVEASMIQPDDAWGVGTYQMSVTYSGRSCNVPVEVVSNPVDEISFEPAGDYMMMEEVDGYWSDEGDGDEPQFVYSTPGFREGDRLVVTASGGSKTTYTYQEWRYSDESGEWQDEGFVSGSGAALPEGYGPLMYFAEGDAHGVGMHDLVVEYYGRTCTTSVEIVKNPVKSISFEPAVPYKLTEGVDGGWSEDDDGISYFHYDTPSIADGDVLTVVDGDSNEVEYVYSQDDQAFVSESGESVEVGSVDFSYAESQSEAHWSTGETHQVVVTYSGRTCTFPVEIVANLVESISFKPIQGYQLIDELDGTWFTADGYWAQGPVENGVFRYAEPSFQEGDVLTVVGSNGSQVEYTYRHCEGEEQDWCFESEEGEQIEENEVQKDLAQPDGTWGAGTYQMSVTYSGRSCDVSVEVVANPVKSISFKPHSPYRMLKESEDYGEWVSVQEDSDDDGEAASDASQSFFYYHLPWFAEGDKFIVTGIDGTVRTYTYAYVEAEEDSDDDYGDYVVLKAADGSTIDLDAIDFSSDQWLGGGWDAGTHQMTLAYMGRTCDVDIKVIEEASVKGASITFAKKSYAYTGSPIKPGVTVKVGEETLEQGTDYTVSYKDNTKAGTATVTVEGKGIYVDSASATFKIDPVSIKNAKLTLSKSVLIFNKKAQKPTVATVGGKKLKANTDYTVKYSNAKSTKVGSYTVQVTGKGNYAGVSKKATYKILNANPVKVGVKKPSVSLAKLKKAKQVVAAKNAFSVTGNKGGKVTYKKASGDKALTVAANGNVTVAKGAKKGPHSVKVTASIAAKGNYAAATKTVTLKVTVK